MKYRNRRYCLMKKKNVIIILIAIVFIVLIKITIDLNSPGSSVKINSITYKIYDNYNKGSFDYSKRGYYIVTYKMPNSPWFYIITMGTKSTGGYSIEISEIKIDENNNVKIIVKENTPETRRNSNYGIYSSSCMCRIK